MSNASVSRIIARQARALESILKRVESQHAATSAALVKVREALDDASSDLGGEPAGAAKVKVTAAAITAKKKKPGAVEEAPAQTRRERRAARAAKAGAAVPSPAKKKLAGAAPAPSKKSSSLKKTLHPSGFKKAPVAAK